MRPTWDDLQLHQVDLHIHCGTERPIRYTALDFIRFAVATGRRVIGATDHFAFFLERSGKRTNHYSGDLDGYKAFSRDIRDAKQALPDEIVLFGPEIGLGLLHEPEANDAFIIQDIDFFIGEAGRPHCGQTLGDYLLQGIRDIAELRSRHRCPGVLGHPLRWPIDDYVGKTGRGPSMPNHGPLPPLGSYSDPKGHVEELLGIDLGALATELSRFGVPIEINEGSWARILALNHQSFAERYLFFYRSLIHEGVKVVLGSDMHNAEHGAATPFVVARILGIRPRDMTFLAHWLGEAAGLTDHGEREDL